MPTVDLKPGSPEYADDAPAEDGAAPATCDMPGCEAAPGCRAPKDARLREYYDFCPAHAREYNAAWNYFADLPPGEAAAHAQRARYGDRPTWRYGVGAEEMLRQAADRMRWTERSERAPEPEPAKRGPAPAPDTPEGAALALMGLDVPLTLDEIKARYRVLAKRHHPDRNAGSRAAADTLKKINMAFTVLSAAWGRWEALLAGEEEP